MENLLPQRPKTLALMVLSVFLLVSLALHFSLFKPPDLDNAAVEEAVLANLRSIETTLENKISDYKKRAASVFDKYHARQLQHSELGPKETLVFTQKGIIKDYYGEIYHFKFKKININDWLFIDKKNMVFFVRKMAKDIFYVKFFCRLDNNFILEQLAFDVAIKEITFFREKKIDNEKNTYQYDEARDMFFYSHLLKDSNNQLALHLRFSQQDIRNHYKKREILFFYLVLFLFLSGAAVYFYFIAKKRILFRVLWFGLLLESFVFVSREGERNLYLKAGNTITLYSIYEIFFILIAVISLLYWARDKIKIKITAYALFNLFLLLMLKASHAIFKAVNFNYTEFSVFYLILILLIFLLHLFPLFFIRNISLKRNPVHMGGFLLFQTGVLMAGYYLLKLHVVNLLVVSMIAFLMMFFERKFLVRVAVVFLLALSIFHLANRHAIDEKKEFIANNLKDIFLNQNNYAKFMAREIVHELNLESRHFHEFFQKDSSSRLKTIWKKTMASRENIASGIFVLSPEGVVLSDYAYLMQFLEVETRSIFPFWAIEDAAAELYGQKIPLAVASINVVRKAKQLGRIVVQVLNAPELILRHQDKLNIFTIDNKINGMDLSYIKVNERKQIVDNPSNINLENVAGILKFNDQWITFRFIDLMFNGYIFKHDKDTIIIFFPAHTMFKDLSEIIKIFLWLLVLFFSFYFKDLKKLDWKSIYYSFSIRVFSILIVISLFTAIIFSLFSINFNSQSSLRQSRQVMYERGRTAQNIGYNLLEEEHEFSPNHLALISRTLNSDVSVYKNGILLEASNYRKIINAEIPDFLHSNILELLNQKNQKFVLLDGENGFHLYFKIYDYILDVEFSYDWPKLLSEKGYYTNFIITLFFILTIIGFSSAFFFRNKILSPINDLNKGMAEVEKGDLHRLKKIPSEIEIKNLYTGFNAMIEGIREQRKNISEISRMKTIIKLGRRVAHEVKNPLTPIKLSAEQILMALRDKNPDYENIIKQSVNYIIDETKHLKKVSYGFLDLSKLDELTPETFDLRALVREEVFNNQQVYSHIAFSLDEEPREAQQGRFMVTLDKFKIKQVLKNLINNSIEAIGEKRGEIKLDLEYEADRVLIEVKDNGIGMDEKGLNMVYNIDYSTKQIGTGLGLFIVKRIIDLHKGTIDIESEKNKGTRVIMELPVKV